MQADRIVETFETGFGAIGAMVALDAIDRRDARRAAHLDRADVVARWQAYASLLDRQLAASRRREAQLAADLAEALTIIEASRRRND